MRTLLILILLALLVTPVASATVSYRTEPAEPTFLDPFTITVVVTACPHHVVELGAVTRAGQTLTIQLIEEDDCGGVIGIPVVEDFEFPVLMEPLAAGSYDLEIRDRNMELIDVFLITIKDVQPHPLEPAVTTYPRQPNDNQNVLLLVPVLHESCIYRSLEIASIERQGRDIEVNMQVDVAAACVPIVIDETESDVLIEELGQLSAGNYRAAVYLTESDEGQPQPPILVAYKEFEVTDDEDRALLQNQRFRVSAEWRDFEGQTGVAKPVPGASDESTLFTFFAQDNWELMVKVLDGCAINDRFWVLGAAATNVEYTLTITDSVTDEVWTYSNSLGELSPAFADTEAFASSCQP